MNTTDRHPLDTDAIVDRIIPDRDAIGRQVVSLVAFALAPQTDATADVAALRLALSAADRLAADIQANHPDDAARLAAVAIYNTLPLLVGTLDHLVAQVDGTYYVADQDDRNGAHDVRHYTTYAAQRDHVRALAPGGDMADRYTLTDAGLDLPADR